METLYLYKLGMGVGIGGEANLEGMDVVRGKGHRKDFMEKYNNLAVNGKTEANAKNRCLEE